MTQEENSDLSQNLLQKVAHDKEVEFSVKPDDTAQIAWTVQKGKRLLWILE